MKINDTIILEELITILDILKTDLQSRDVFVFRDIKNNGDNIQVTCPFHKGGKEKKPSFGIHKESGKCNCFTCGWKGNLISLIEALYGRYETGKFGVDWLVKRFSTQTIENRVVPKIELSVRKEEKTQTIEVVSEAELQSYRHYHPYMFQRKLSHRIIKMFDVGYDQKTNCLTFPVRDADNRCLFVARRSVRYKYFNYPKSAYKPVYALDAALKESCTKITVTESILNCLILWKLGIPAVSLMGLGSENQLEILKNCNVRHIVLALDPDTAGKEAQERIRKSLNKHKVITQINYTDSNKDINDLDWEYLQLKEIL